jgi:predicted peroxiredoxin
MAMAHRVLVNLTTGMEDPERVTVALLIATSALEQGKEVMIFATQEAVRLGLPGVAVGEGCEGCPPLERLFTQFEERGGELWLCPFCFNARHLDEGEILPNAKIAGATPMWQWAGDDATVIGY